MPLSWPVRPAGLWGSRCKIGWRVPGSTCTSSSSRPSSTAARRECGKTSQAPVPWASKGSGFSMLMEAFVVTMCASLPVAHVARLVGVSDDRIWRVLRRHVHAARAKEDFAEIRCVGVDEAASRKGQRYVTLFHDLDRRRLLFATPGRDKTTFTRFADDLKALDQVRRAEVKHHPELKHSRWGTLKAPRRWNAAQIHTMHWLQRSSLKTARAWRLKEALRRIYETTPNRAMAEPLLKRWISWARRCRLTAFKKLGATIRDHLAGILRHFDTGLSNGQVEAFNAQIQAAKARAKGYRTDANLIAISYLLCAKLRHLPVIHGCMLRLRHEAFHWNRDGAPQHHPRSRRLIRVSLAA